MTGSSITIHGVPTSLTRAQVCDLLRALGLDPNELTALTLHPDGVEVEVYANQRPGNKPAWRWTHNGDDVATHRLTIPIIDEEKP